jgi:hypothetical protein
VPDNLDRAIAPAVLDPGAAHSDETQRSVYWVTPAKSAWPADRARRQVDVSCATLSGGADGTRVEEEWAQGRPLKGAAPLGCYIQLDIIGLCGPVRFLGDSLKCLRDFPQGARHDAGYQLDKVQRGHQPDDFKPMPGIGNGCRRDSRFEL